MNDTQCLGICLIDPDSGACLGCGRLPEEISGVPTGPATRTAGNAGKAVDGLPPNVAAAAAEPTD